MIKRRLLQCLLGGTVSAVFLTLPFSSASYGMDFLKSMGGIASGMANVAKTNLETNLTNNMSGMGCGMLVSQYSAMPPQQIIMSFSANPAMAQQVLGVCNYGAWVSSDPMTKQSVQMIQMLALQGRIMAVAQGTGAPITMQEIPQNLSMAYGGNPANVITMLGQQVGANLVAMPANPQNPAAGFVFTSPMAAQMQQQQMMMQQQQQRAGAVPGQVPGALGQTSGGLGGLNQQSAGGLGGLNQQSAGGLGGLNQQSAGGLGGLNQQSAGGLGGLSQPGTGLRAG